MTSTRDQQIRAIYQAALERPIAERAAFVSRLTGSDHELRQSVDRLLAEQNATNVGARGDVDTGDAPELAAGTCLGHYRIDSVLGRGGMGTVYRATDTKLQRPVAIKFSSIAEADAEAKRRFRQEAQTASSLNHPHIVTVHDVGEQDGRQYIVSEVVDGGTLDDWSAASRRPGWRRCTELLIGVADALAAAHTAAVLHRDVKPGNILIGSNGYAKLADFGLAKLLHASAGTADANANASHDTRAGMVVGTIAYMSPEQASGLPLDARSDIFSFGIVLYELLAGRRPFEAANDLELLKTIVHAAPSPLPSDVPELLRNVVERALEKDPADRYQSMRELVIELKRIVRKSASAAQPALPGDPSAGRSPLLWWVAVSAIVVLVGVFAAMNYYLREPNMAAQARPAALARDYEIARLTTSGNAVAPALSSDGNYVAYVQQGGAGPSVWIKQLASGSDVRIVDSQPASGLLVPIVRPDNSFVDFLLDSRPITSAPQLWRVPFLGGSPRRLVENVWSPIGWSADGRQMAFVRVDAAADSSSIILADADGQRERVLAAYGSQQEWQLLSLSWNPDPFGAPAWSPDGRTLAVFATKWSSYRPQVLFLDTATGAEIAVIDSGGGFTPHGLAWLDSESLLLNQPVETGAPVQLWRMTYPGGAVSRLTNDLSSYVGVTVDADRASLVTAQSETRGSLWVGDAAGSAGSEIVPLTPTVQTSVAWAGDRVLYGSLTNGRPGTASVPAAGGASMEVVRSAVTAVATSDGARIVYVKETGGADVGLWVADADGRQARQLVAGLVGNPIVTPDDQHVIFLSYRTIQSPWMMSLDGGEPTQIVDVWAGSPSLNVSPDGRRLLFLGSDSQNRFMFVVCELPSCANRREFALPANFRSPFTRLTPDGEGIAYIESSAMNIWSLPLAGGAPQQITHFTDRSIDSFAWSPEGTRLAVLRTTTTNDIVVLKGLKE